MTELVCHVQRLDPPIRSEPVPARTVVYQNAVVVELAGGTRLVFSRVELSRALEAPDRRLA